MADYVPNFEPGSLVTYQVGATAVTGGQVLAISATGRTVIPTTAAARNVVGVAKHDAAVGASITVSRGGEQRLTAAGAITAGTPVKSAAAGAVAAWQNGTDDASLIIGVAINTAADTAAVDVLWRA